MAVQVPIRMTVGVAIQAAVQRSVAIRRGLFDGLLRPAVSLGGHGRGGWPAKRVTVDGSSRVCGLNCRGAG